ncbi:MAG: hypothetical protein RIS21_975 [Planctomycetota bacterium]|jgi:hypothetical protein
MRTIVKKDPVTRVLVPLDGRTGFDFAVRHGARLAASRQLPLAFVLFAPNRDVASHASRRLSETLRGATAAGAPPARLVVSGNCDYSTLGREVGGGDLVLLAQDAGTRDAMHPYTRGARRLLVLSEGGVRS